MSRYSGWIECIPDAYSIDFLKKTVDASLLTIYETCFSLDWTELQKNMAESLAGYSLVCYFLEVKDRHNGNILIDHEGHLIHIDFGFIFQHGPGGMKFESAPFKLTKEYIDLLGGMESDMFHYF